MLPGRSQSNGLVLAIDELPDFVRGAAFLGAGGGGDPYIGRLMLEHQMKRTGAVRILAPEMLADDGFVASVGCMGAPTVMTEKLPSVAALELALRTLEKHAGRKATAIIPLEIGGINATLPLVLAGKLDLPVVNGDGMGRAFPEIQMVTFGVYGCNLSPAVVTNERNDAVVVYSENNKRGEDLARSVVTQMGGMAQIALYPMSGADVKRTSVHGTLTLALEIGRSIGSARSSGSDPFAALFETLGKCRPKRDCATLHEGKVVDVLRKTEGGFNVGLVRLRSINGDKSRFEVHYQNENILAMRNGSLAAIVPDLIVFLDQETADPIPTEQIRYGQRIKVVAVTVPDRMTTPEALAVFGPAAFSLDAAYRPFPQLRV